VTIVFSAGKTFDLDEKSGWILKNEIARGEWNCNGVRVEIKYGEQNVLS
jgi:hypothetical protein